MKTNTVLYVWSVFVLGLAIFSFPLARYFFVLPHLIVVATIVCGVITYSIWGLDSLFRKKVTLRKLSPIIATIVITIVASLSFLFGGSSDIFTYFKLPVYQEIVTKLQKGTLKEFTYKGVRFDTDTVQGQLIVAFPDGLGFVDNWCGWIWDPTGFVEQANKFKSDWSNWGDPSLGGIKNLFGGDLMWVEHKTGPWYEGCFT